VEILAMSAIRDATEKRAEQERVRLLNEELQRANQQLEATNRELEAFSYSVSHDLRAPLRAMDGFSRILLEEEAARLSADGQRRLRLIRDNAQQMGELISDLLTFSRLSRQPLNRRPVAPAAVARQALADLQAECDGRPLELSIPELPACQADPSLLKLVFVNLLSNALKFTRGREPAVIEVGYREDGGQPVYFVKDNGVGFDMRYKDKLFGVFQRLHRAEEYPGTGVGLATVQRIVHRHDGRVWGEAEVDRGATLYFTLGGGAAGE
jgi:light-regulated signal transduction histidine kinase (bacteriophytochrome)